MATAARRPTPAVFRRRRLTALAVLAGVVALLVWLVAALAGGGGPPTGAARGAGDARRGAPPPAPQLPGGGRRLFPDRRVVAFYGNPRSAQLGALGIGSPSQMTRRLRRVAAPYARRTRPVLPALELISTVATAAPGAGALHRTHMPAAMIDRYLRAARRAHALLVLDLQPGRSDFLSEAKRLERWLVQPDVGLALDPEWRVGADQVPGQVIGGVDVAEVDAVTAWLAQLVRAHRLPEKLVVLHRFTDDMLRGPAPPAPRPGLAMVVNVDGFGTPSAKVGKYHAYARGLAPGLHRGLKLFFHEDTHLMRPRTVMSLRPRPDLVVYE